MKRYYNNGQSLVEIILVIGLMAIILPAIFVGISTSRQGKAQQQQRLQAVALLQATEESLRSVREKDWNAFAVDGTFHPVASGSGWGLVAGQDLLNGFTRQTVISDVYRATASGAIVASPASGYFDASTKQADITVSWSSPLPSVITSTIFLTRYLGNLSYNQSTVSDFNADTSIQTQVTNTSGGEVTIANNTKAKWCSPSFSPSTIDLPDGPPVSVAATASANTNTIPNDVFVATAPYATSSVKLAYVKVPANVDPPAPVLQGTFTLDASKYSSPSAVPAGINLDNNYSTNSVKYYKSASGKLYALLATTKPDHEIVVVQVNNGSGDSFQDSTNKIYKYWTFFNTRQYQGDVRSTPNQDQSPYGYGGSSLAVLGSKGYVTSGGFLYTFDLSNIDTKTPANGLDMVGCRIELEGYDCNTSTSMLNKYGAGSTGGSYAGELAGQNGCVDGGNIQKYATNDITPVQVGANTYIYAAVGAGVDAELEIANVTSVPTNATAPKINASACGTVASGNAGWKQIGKLDFNSMPNTQETANSVFAKSDGTRAYISSNGGVDGNNDGKPDSDQFYVIDTTTKSAPKFLTGTSSTGAQSGYYNGNATNIQMFPRRSLTVLNGQRVVLVGQDGFPNDAIEPQEYQVLNTDTESSPNYCGGLNFVSGFNDLTSVSEADGDNFVYMVANTPDHQLKIIQGGPDGTYLDQGTLESPPIDASHSTTFNRYTASISTPANTSLQFQFAGTDPIGNSCAAASYTYVGPDGTSGTYYTATMAALLLNNANGYKNPAQCFRYKAYLKTTDFNATPILKDMSINYSP